MSKRIFLLALFILLGIVFNFKNVYAQPEAVDLIFVVDESGSMAGEHAWLQGMVADLDTALKNAGIGVSMPNQYGLVGFGGLSSHLPGHKHTVGGSDWGAVTDIQAAFNTLLTNGGTEDGYDGIEVALTEYTFRSNTAKNIILVTDEDRDVVDSNLDYNSILNLLRNKGALLNVVVNQTFTASGGASALGVNSNGEAYIADGQGGYTKVQGYTTGVGAGSTLTDYVNLALAVGGGAWDLNTLRQGGVLATSFTNAFIDAKVQEIQQQIPEPTTIFLVGIGFGVLPLFARYRKKG